MKKLKSKKLKIEEIHYMYYGNSSVNMAAPLWDDIVDQITIGVESIIFEVLHEESLES